MKRVFLVRHGETAGNSTRTLRGNQSAGDPLTRLGENQARACAAAFQAMQLPDPRVYASTYLRAQQTAQAIADALNTTVTVRDGLHEISIGTWEGRPYSDLHYHAAELHAQGGFAFPGGEHIHDVTCRAHPVLEDIAAQDGTPVIVTHNLTLTALLCHMTASDYLPAWQKRQFNHDNTAITELSFDGQKWQVVKLAQSGHLTVK